MTLPAVPSIPLQCLGIVAADTATCEDHQPGGALGEGAPPCTRGVDHL